jgi:hypothetical protein
MDMILLAEYNVALSGVASSSSVYASGFPAAEAINGKKPMDFNDNFISKLEAGAWWKVELGGAYDISQVVVYNRVTSMRLAGFEVVVNYKGEEVFRFADNTAWTNDNTAMDYDVFPWENVVDLGQITRADEIIVKLPDTKKSYLELEEVEVFGSPAGKYTTSL